MGGEMGYYAAGWPEAQVILYHRAIRFSIMTRSVFYYPLRTTVKICQVHLNTTLGLCILYCTYVLMVVTHTDTHTQFIHRHIKLRLVPASSCQ